MALKVYNTLTRDQSEFVPRDPGKASIYTCGVTPYNFCHVGNARPYIVWDVIRRYLWYKGYKVRYIQNFTDVDDKIIERAHNEGVEPLDIADQYIDEYFTDMDALGIIRADVYPRVTDHISDIIDLVEKLIAAGHAYVVEGDVYYSVASYPKYGQLSGRSLEDLKAGARVDVDERKREPVDFALWKASKEGEPAWESPWGLGRPGWHIECSAMALKYLGADMDFHGGGSDLIFPHHENEIAQSEGALGESFTRYWLHNGFVNMAGEKMAKSVGNVVRVRDVIEKYPGEVLRYYMLSTHYRSPIDFSMDEMPGAQRGYERIRNLEGNLSRALEGQEAALPEERSAFVAEALEVLDKHRAAFEEAMDDDFNTARAMAALFELIRYLNSLLADGEVSGDRAAVLAEGQRLFLSLGDVLGLTGAKGEDRSRDHEPLLHGLIALATELRQEARERKDYGAADKIRDRLTELGIVLEDKASGSSWHYKQ